MLILTRRLDEVVCIGPDVRVKIVDIRGDRVALGFEAPDDVEIDRLEIRESKCIPRLPERFTFCGRCGAEETCRRGAEEFWCEECRPGSTDGAKAIAEKELGAQTYKRRQKMIDACMEQSKESSDDD